jgi:uncharacterized protein YkwD
VTIRLTLEYLVGHPTGTTSTRQDAMPWLAGLEPAAVILPPCTAPCPAILHDLDDQVFALVNQHRAGIGRGVLLRDSRLDADEEWKCLNMAANAYLDHNDDPPPISRTVAARFADYYPVGTAGWGENLAYGFTDAQSVMQAFLSDDGHRANVENPSWVGYGGSVTQLGPGGFDGKGSGAGLIWFGQAYGTASVVKPGPDTQPPTAPTGLHAAVSGATVDLAWNASTDDHGVAGYVLTVDGGVYGTVGLTDITLHNVAPGTHTATVTAVDGAGNRSQPTQPVTFAVVVASGHVLDQWLNGVLPLIAQTSQYQKWIASTTKAGKADVAKWNAYLGNPHAAPPSMLTPYGKALVADLALAAAQP